MANKLYSDTNIQGIADAIRAKNGSTATYKVSEMATAINAIESVKGTVNLTLTNLTAKVTSVNGSTASLTLVPANGYELPENVTFSSGITDGTYNNLTGVTTFSLPNSGTESVTASGAALEPYLGVKWVNDDTTTMQRTGIAKTMTYSVDSTTGKFTSDFDNVFPYNQMKRTTIGTNIFVTVPAMWFRIGYDTDNKIVSIAVHDSQGDPKTETGVTYVWHQTRAFNYGAYGASSNGTTLSSISGAGRVASITRAMARTRAAATGTGYHQRDLYAGTILMFLFWIEYANKASVNFPTTLNGVYPTMDLSDPVQTGGTDSIYSETAGANFCVSGYNPTTNQMVWHGIEDFFGNTEEWEDGITGNATSGGTQYVSDDYTKYNDTGADMDTLSFNAPTTTGYCLEALGWDNTKPFLVQPISSRDDSAYKTGFTDLVSINNNIVSDRGSNWTAGASFGVSCFNRRSSMAAYPTIGARLMKEV